MILDPRTAAWLAVALYVTFVVAVSVRGFLHAQRTGSMGVHIGPGAGLLAAAFSFAGVIMFAVAVVLQIRGRVEPWFVSWIAAGAGTGLVVAGTVLAIAGQATMGASWRSGVDERERTDLVTSGVFAWSRNPIYLGMLVSLAGLSLLVPSVLMLAAIGLSVVGVQVQVRLAEEPYLLRTHGDRYREYADRVGRFIPAVGRGVRG